MRQTKATLRYAKSLFVLANEQDILEKCRQDMQFIADTCNGSKELSLLLKSPIIKTDQKLAIFKEVFYENWLFVETWKYLCSCQLTKTR